MKLILINILLLIITACNNKNLSKEPITERISTEQKILSTEDSINVIRQNFNLTNSQVNSLKFSSNLRNRFFFFNEIKQNDFVLKKTITYDQINLIYFDFSEDTYFNFIEFENKIIFSDEGSLYKTKLSRKLSDWDNDGKVDMIEKFSICEAGCLSEKSYEIVYHITHDSVYVKHRSEVITK